MNTKIIILILVICIMSISSMEYVSFNETDIYTSVNITENTVYSYQMENNYYNTNFIYTFNTLHILIHQVA